MSRSWLRRVLLAVGIGLVPAALAAAERDAGAEPVYTPPATEAAAPAQGAAAEEVPQYQPPGLGSPKGRTSGGTRGFAAPGIDLIAPADHVGLTTSAQPTLYWQLSGATTARVELVLRDEKATKPFFERTLPTPAGAGLQAVSLEEFGVSLPIDVDYQWSIALVMDEEHRSRDVVATAWIRRVEPSRALAERLASDPAKAAVAYAASGVWYDAFRVSTPSQRGELLGQVGLGALARGETGGATEVIGAK